MYACIYLHGSVGVHFWPDAWTGPCLSPQDGDSSCTGMSSVVALDARPLEGSFQGRCGGQTSPRGGDADAETGCQRQTANLSGARVKRAKNRGARCVVLGEGERMCCWVGIRAVDSIQSRFILGSLGLAADAGHVAASGEFDNGLHGSQPAASVGRPSSGLPSTRCCCSPSARHASRRCLSAGGGIYTSTSYQYSCPLTTTASSTPPRHPLDTLPTPSQHPLPSTRLLFARVFEHLARRRLFFFSSSSSSSSPSSLSSFLSILHHCSENACFPHWSHSLPSSTLDLLLSCCSSTPGLPLHRTARPPGRVWRPGGRFLFVPRNARVSPSTPTLPFGRGSIFMYTATDDSLVSKPVLLT